jgi:hypothetical protein
MDDATAYLRDQTTKRTVSSVATLGPSNRDTGSPVTYHVQLNTNHHPPTPPSPMGALPDALENTELVLVPNVDARPTLVIPWLKVLPADESYPRIPDAAQVSGTVASQGDGLPIAADVVVTSTKLYTTSDLIANLVYSTFFHTDPDGNYTVLLPPGDYDVVVTPQASGFAKTVSTLLVDAAHATQAGKSLVANRKRVVTGSAVVSDGRPLAGADVIAQAAAAGQPGGDAPERRPRAGTARTDALGSFTLELDSGTYDFIIRPKDGSRLPWVVSPSRVVGETDVVLSTIDIPAPIDASMKILDPVGNHIPQALVRAFAQPVATSGESGAPPYVEIGRAYTDGTSSFEMYLAGVPH